MKKLKHLMNEGIIDFIAKILAKPSANKKWKELQNDPELKKYYKTIETTQKNIDKIKSDLESDPKLAKYFKDMGVKLD